MKYNVVHFIRKFEATKEEDWCTGAYIKADGRRCAFGMCGCEHYFPRNPESDALTALFYTPLLKSVIQVNDGRDEDFRQPTPRQRILAALYDIKAREAS